MFEAAATRVPVILVVEDEPLVRMLAVDTFDEAGFDVIEAANGHEAVEILKSRPDVRAVFTDVHMPGRPDGIALARHVQEVCPDCAIVVVSGRGVPEMPDLGSKVRFFPKPYRTDAMVRVVRDLLDA
jgi:two-component system, response regulator PdtaR